MVDGITIDLRLEGSALPLLPSTIVNIDAPIRVRPSTNVTWLNDEEAPNAPNPMNCNGKLMICKFSKFDRNHNRNVPGNNNNVIH